MRWKGVELCRSNNSLLEAKIECWKLTFLPRLGCGLSRTFWTMSGCLADVFGPCFALKSDTEHVFRADFYSRVMTATRSFDGSRPIDFGMSRMDNLSKNRTLGQVGQVGWTISGRFGRSWTHGCLCIGCKIDVSIWSSFSSNFGRKSVKILRILVWFLSWLNQTWSWTLPGQPGHVVGRQWCKLMSFFSGEIWMAIFPVFYWLFPILNMANVNIGWVAAVEFENTESARNF